MLEEPPIPASDSDVITQLCLSQNKVVAYINPAALESLLWDFWWLAAQAPNGEDISLSNVGELMEIPKCSPLAYCEITMVGEGPVMGYLHNPVAEYREYIDQERVRVDLYVNRLQAEQGYQSVQCLGGIEAGARVEQVELFGRLILRLVAV